MSAGSGAGSRRARRSFGGARSSVIVGLVVAVLISATAHASYAVTSVAPERWARSVCHAMSQWLDQRSATDAQVQAIVADVAAAKVSPKAAKKRLGAAYAKGLAASTTLVKSVKAAGVPKITDGKAVATQYLGTLSRYATAYESAARTAARSDARTPEAVGADAQQVTSQLAADVSVVGVDPIEDLRSVGELAAPLAAACTDVEAYLIRSLDGPCRAAVDSIKVVLDAEKKFQDAPAGTPEEDAADDATYEASHALRAALGGCNVPGVAAGGCRTALQTAAAYVDAAGRFESTPVDSPEESTALDDMSARIVDLEGQIPKCGV